MIIHIKKTIYIVTLVMIFFIMVRTVGMVVISRGSLGGCGAAVASVGQDFLVVTPSEASCYYSHMTFTYG